MRPPLGTGLLLGAPGSSGKSVNPAAPSLHRVSPEEGLWASNMGHVTLNNSCFVGCVGTELVLNVTMDWGAGVSDVHHLLEAGLLSCHL